MYKFSIYIYIYIIYQEYIGAVLPLLNHQFLICKISTGESIKMELNEAGINWETADNEIDLRKFKRNATLIKDIVIHDQPSLCEIYKYCNTILRLVGYSSLSWNCKAFCDAIITRWFK